MLYIVPDCKKAIYPLLGKIELAIFPGVFNTALSLVKYPEMGKSIYPHFHKISAVINHYIPKYHNSRVAK